MLVTYKYPIRIRGKITSVPRLFSKPLHQMKKRTSDYECTHQMGLFDTHFVQFGQVLPISVLKLLVTYKYPIRIRGKITSVPRLFSEPLHQMKKRTSDYECTHQMGLFDTHFVQFGQVLPISVLKLLVTYKYPIRIRGKITTGPRLFSEPLHQMKNKHQIMNVHIKWDCLIPILSSLVKYYQFQG